MRIVFQILSWLALAGTLLPSVMFLGGVLELDKVKTVMLVATMVWFVCTPVWMGRAPVAKSGSDATQPVI